MSKVCDAILTYISSTSKVWLYSLSLIFGVTIGLLAAELYHERMIYQAFHASNWTNMTTWALVLCAIWSLEILITCISVFYEKNKFIKRFITPLYIMNILAIVALLILLPQLAEVKKKTKFLLQEAMHSYNFMPTILPSGAQYTGPIPQQMVHMSSSIPPPPPPGMRLSQNQFMQNEPGILIQQQQQMPIRFDSNQEYARFISTELWDYLQNYYKCCGIEDEKDWLKFSPQNKYYPRSCCSVFSMDNSNSMCKQIESNRKGYGCLRAVKNLHVVSLSTYLVAMLVSLLLAAVSYIQGVRYEEYDK